MTKLAPLQIGPVRIDSPVVLAPMTGVTDRPFRTLVKRYGAGLTVTEMPYDEMSRCYYRQDDRSEYNLFFLASNFGLVFNPAPAVSADAAHQGVYNTTGIADAALEAAAKAGDSRHDAQLFRWPPCGLESLL